MAASYGYYSSRSGRSLSYCASILVAAVVLVFVFTTVSKPDESLIRTINARNRIWAQYQDAVELTHQLRKRAADHMDFLTLQSNKSGASSRDEVVEEITARRLDEDYCYSNVRRFISSLVSE